MHQDAANFFIISVPTSHISSALHFPSCFIWSSRVCFSFCLSLLWTCKWSLMLLQFLSWTELMIWTKVIPLQSELNVLNIDYFAHLLNRLNGKSFRLQAICLCWKFVLDKDPIGCHNLFIGWQESKCVLKHPKPAIKSKMFSLQDCNSSRPNVIGSLSLPIFNLGFKHFIPLSRGVSFSTWSWKPWWIFRDNLCLFLFH